MIQQHPSPSPPSPARPNPNADIPPSSSSPHNTSTTSPRSSRLIHGPLPSPPLSSTSSRSPTQKKARADFEDALRRPHDVIYLTSSSPPPRRRESDPAAESAAATPAAAAAAVAAADAAEDDYYEEPHGRQAATTPPLLATMLSSRSPARSSSHGHGATESLMGEDVVSTSSAAKLRAKRAAREAARANAAAAAANAAAVAVNSAGVGAGADQPPSPTTIDQVPVRRESVTSTDSRGSNHGSSAARAQQRKALMAQQLSLGLDAEIKAEDQAITPKRRSIFRTTGTASTPDLSTLIRGGRKQSGKQQTAKEAAKHPMPPYTERANSLTSHLSTSTSSLSRNRQQPHLSPRGNDREPLPGTGSAMTTIAEGTIEYHPPRSASIDENGKFKRSKPKGMFGRMFGSTSSDKQHHHHGPLTSSSQISLSARSQADLSPPSQSSPHVPSNAFPTGSHGGAPQFPGNPHFQFDPSQQPSNGARPPIPQRPSVPIVPRENRSSIVSVDRNSDNPEILEPLESGKTTKTHTRNTSVTSVASSVGPQPSVAHVTRSDTYDSISSRAPVSRKPTAEAVAAAATATAAATAAAAAGGAGGAARHAGSSFTDDVTGLLEQIGHGEQHAALGLRAVPGGAAQRHAHHQQQVHQQQLQQHLQQELLLQQQQQQQHDVGDTEHLTVSPDMTNYLPQRASPFPDHSPVPSVRSDSRGHETGGLVAEALPVPERSGSGHSRHSADRSRSPNNNNNNIGSDTVQEPVGVPEMAEVGAPDDSAIGVAVGGPETPPKEAYVASPKSQQGEWAQATNRNGSVGTPTLIAASGSQITIDVTSSPDQSTTNLIVDMNEDDNERARLVAAEIYEGDTTHIPTGKVAMFLGGPRLVNTATLHYYMQYFDMRGRKLDQAFRDLCGKLHLKAESQEIDRIIEGFSARYYDCNPSTVFGTPGVVHTVTGAMLMLNTDLHIADLPKHMSRADFVRNSMRAIQESMPNPESEGPDFTGSPNESGSLRNLDPSSANQSTTSVRMRPPTSASTTPRNASGGLASPVSDLTSVSTHDLRSRASSTTVNSFTYTKAWEAEAENCLKEIYTNVRNERILLPISSQPDSERQSTVSLGAFGRNQRAGGAVGVMQGAVAGAIGGMKRASRSQGGNNNPYNGNPMFQHSDGRLSPASGSYANGIGEQYQAFTPALGFAGNLSHTVIKEQEDETHSVRSNPTTASLEELTDDELALLGAPWAKEGLLSRKIQVEAAGKKPQKKDWKQYFVVIQKGDLHMFVFGSGSSSMGGGGAVGGGNWLSNAKTSGEYSLMHAMAMALPKPGYSASRPYCFTVTFPSGEISVFQAGTEELVAEWVATCNYWAARKSRQPLVGGVSNMEYGWNRAATLDEEHEDHHDRASVRSSRTRLGAINRVRNAGGSHNFDKIHVNEWKPPPHATMPSTLDEEAQLESLSTYVQTLKEELNQHKSVEEPMTRLYSPGSRNAIRARDNWTAKSRYIHSEIFKYETFVEALRNAIQLRVQRQGEKKLERSLARSTVSLHHQEGRAGAAGAAGGVHTNAAPRPPARNGSTPTPTDGPSDSDGNGYVTGDDGRVTPAR